MATVNSANSLKVAGKHRSLPGRSLALYREAAAQTYVQGALLALASGLVQEATSGSADAEVLVGIGANAGQNLATKPVTQVEPATHSEVFSGILGNSGDDLFTLVDNRADIGKFAVLIKDGTNGGWYLNASTASTTIMAGARVRIVGVVDEKAPITGNTTVNPRVYFVFLAQGQNAANNAALPHSLLYS